MIQQVKHDVFAGIDDEESIIGMCIKSKYRDLWAAARDKRLLRFDIK